MLETGQTGDVAKAPRGYERRDYERRVVAMARVCRRIEDGENLTEVCRDPTMPRRTTVMSWVGRYPEFRQQLEAAQAVCPEQVRRYHAWSEKVASEFLARIEDGLGLREVCAEPDMPVHQTITRWLNQRTEFATRYRMAREAQADRLFDLAWRIACDADEHEVRSARLKIETLKWRIGRIVPRKYGPWKAVVPEPTETVRSGKRKPDLWIEVRRFAKKPDGELAEITEAIRGMTSENIKIMQADILAGRRPPPPQTPNPGMAERTARWKSGHRG